MLTCGGGLTGTSGVVGFCAWGTTGLLLTGGGWTAFGAATYQSMVIIHDDDSESLTGSRNLGLVGSGSSLMRTGTEESSCCPWTNAARRGRMSMRESMAGSSSSGGLGGCQGLSAQLASQVSCVSVPWAMPVLMYASVYRPVRRPTYNSLPPSSSRSPL